ncbi:MAG: hypothetical protein D6688_14310 [Alphaproteobacteria bacterium]|nr:MAG: hypothetical protein D6688_14310 [Alphaproteobacteria bacterium]
MTDERARSVLNRHAGFEKYSLREAALVREVLYRVAAAALQTPMVSEDGTVYRPNGRKAHVRNPGP